MEPDNPSPGIRLDGVRPRAVRQGGRRFLYVTITLFAGFLIILFWGTRSRLLSNRDQGHQTTIREIASQPADSNRPEIERSQSPAVTPPAVTTVPQVAVQPPPAMASTSDNAAVAELTAQLQAEKEAAKAELAFEQKRRAAPIFPGAQATPATAQAPRTASSPLQTLLTQPAQYRLAATPAVTRQPPPSVTEALLRRTATPQTDDPPQQDETAQASEFPHTAQQEQKPQYLEAQREEPRSLFEIQQGSQIPVILKAQVNSELPGEVTAVVRGNVYDALCGQVRTDGERHCYVLIPDGSQLFGAYNSAVAFGQQRLQIVWTRLFFPDSSSIDLASMNAHDAAGATGVRDQLDQHWARLISGAVFSSVLSAGFQLSQNRSNSSVLNYPAPGQVVAGAVGAEANRTGQLFTQRNLNIRPTAKLRTGMFFSVMVNKTLVLPGFWRILQNGAIEFVQTQ